MVMKVGLDIVVVMAAFVDAVTFVLLIESHMHR